MNHCVVVSGTKMFPFNVRCLDTLRLFKLSSTPYRTSVRRYSPLKPRVEMARYGFQSFPVCWAYICATRGGRELVAEHGWSITLKARLVCWVAYTLCNGYTSLDIPSSILYPFWVFFSCYCSIPYIIWIIQYRPRSFRLVSTAA